MSEEAKKMQRNPEDWAKYRAAIDKLSKGEEVTITLSDGRDITLTRQY